MNLRKDHYRFSLLSEEKSSFRRLSIPSAAPRGGGETSSRDKVKGDISAVLAAPDGHYSAR